MSENDIRNQLYTHITEIQSHLSSIYDIMRNYTKPCSANNITIVEKLKQGDSPKSISQEIKVSRQRISQVAQKYHIPLRPNPNSIVQLKGKCSVCNRDIIIEKAYKDVSSTEKYRKFRLPTFIQCETCKDKYYTCNKCHGIFNNLELMATCNPNTQRGTCKTCYNIKYNIRYHLNKQNTKKSRMRT